ncbi:hypothetical protein KFL_002470130 [Klebsormidium nitens]|uniref:MYND-type domain-containing protein n=1 Tax=Klebsormidium nitens TaxID=105231 RepID=A0A1Y1I3Z1_KLENI|nr:hypothetical protein KFL_002470130 [Klebsormidium nitens]|eukprot:GAQ85654.1 hypothetical protein KFL_002470130 [Klebsormidium nitens]
MATELSVKKDSAAYLEELLEKGDDKSVLEAVGAMHKLCCDIIWHKKQRKQLALDEMQELLLKPTPPLKKVQKLMKNESLVRAVVQLLHHPVLLRDATREERACQQDFTALVSFLGRMAFFSDFAESLDKAGLAQEVANLVDHLQQWTRPVILSSLDSNRSAQYSRWIRRLERFSSCLDLLAEMFTTAEFGREAVRLKLLPALLKAWPPQGFEQPRTFMVVEANQAMCKCAANMLIVLELALKNSAFDEFRNERRNELTEWLLSVLTWQRLLGAQPECAALAVYEEAVEQAWLRVYLKYLGAGRGVRSRVAKRMQKMCKEMLAIPDARSWSPELRGTLETVRKVIDDRMRERDGKGSRYEFSEHLLDDERAFGWSPRGASHVPPDKVAALLRSGKKADVLRGVQAIPAVLLGDLQSEVGGAALMRQSLDGLPYEKAGVRDALMDVFEGPLGNWLLQVNKGADAEAALTSLDSINRRFLNEAAAAEAGDTAPREFPSSEYWRARDPGQEGGRASEAGNGEARSSEHLQGREEADEERKVIGTERDSLPDASVALLSDPDAQKESLDGQTERSDGEKRDSDGGEGILGEEKNLGKGPGGSEMQSEVPHKQEGTSDGRSAQSDGLNGESDGLSGPPAMDPVVLRLLRWIVRRPPLEARLLSAAILPIEIECARVPSARLVAARNAALKLGKRVVEGTFEFSGTQRALAFRAWGMLDALLRENHTCPEEMAEVQRLARELGVAECAADFLGARTDSRSYELHLLNVLEACTDAGAEPALQTNGGFMKRAVASLKYALSVYARAMAEGWDQEPSQEDRATGAGAGLLTAPGVREADDLKLEWFVSKTYLDPPAVWPRVFGAVYQLIKLLSDLVQGEGDAAFVEFVRSGGVEAAAGFLNLSPPRTVFLKSADPTVWETDRETRARKRLADAAALADGLWERAEAKYGLRRCGRVKNAFQRCHQRESKGGTFKQCGRKCGVFYCSRDCQVTHWKEGHKQACTPKNGNVPAPGPTAA